MQEKIFSFFDKALEELIDITRHFDFLYVLHFAPTIFTVKMSKGHNDARMNIAMRMKNHADVEDGQNPRLLHKFELDMDEILNCNIHIGMIRSSVLLSSRYSKNTCQKEYVI